MEQVAKLIDSIERILNQYSGQKELSEDMLKVILVLMKFVNQVRDKMIISKEQLSLVKTNIAELNESSKG